MADNDLSGRPAHGAETGRPAFADWSRTFLGELAATSNVSAAARLAGISSFVVYETRRTTPEFNRKWQEALCEGYDHLEMALLFRLRAGEVTSLVLLSATAMGLATCPVTEPLEISDTRDAVRSDVFGTSGHPQMLLRVGWAAINADPLPATPRRPLPDVADWLNDGASMVGADAVSQAG